MNQPRCPACGGELVVCILISNSALWPDSRPRFVPSTFVGDRSLYGRHRREIATSARACLQCGAVTLFVNPGTLSAMLQASQEPAQAPD